MIMSVSIFLLPFIAKKKTAKMANGMQIVANRIHLRYGER